MIHDTIKCDDNGRHAANNSCSVPNLALLLYCLQSTSLKPHPHYKCFISLTFSPMLSITF